MIIKLISYEKFLELNHIDFELYKNAGLALKPDSWNVSDVMLWDFITVKKIQTIIESDYTFEDIPRIAQILTGYPVQKIMQKLWTEVFAFHNFVVRQIEKINELEKKLVYEPDNTEIEAGIERFGQFGYFATVDALAGGDITKYDQVGAVDYATVYAKLLLNKAENEYRKAYNKKITQ